MVIGGFFYVKIGNIKQQEVVHPAWVTVWLLAYPFTYFFSPSHRILKYIVTYFLCLACASRNTLTGGEFLCLKIKACLNRYAAHIENGIYKKMQ